MKLYLSVTPFSRLTHVPFSSLFITMCYFYMYIPWIFLSFWPKGVRRFFEFLTTGRNSKDAKIVKITAKGRKRRKTNFWYFVYIYLTLEKKKITYDVYFRLGPCPHFLYIEKFEILFFLGDQNNFYNRNAPFLFYFFLFLKIRFTW